MYYYLFYRLYKFFDLVENALTPKSIRTPEYSAMFVSVLLIYFNLFTLELFINKLFGIYLLFFKKEVTISVAVTVLIYFCFIFLYKNKFRKVVERYKEETSEKKKRSTYLTILYVVFTFGFFVFSTLIDKLQ